MPVISIYLNEEMFYKVIDINRKERLKGNSTESYTITARKLLEEKISEYEVI